MEYEMVIIIVLGILFVGIACLAAITNAIQRGKRGWFSFFFFVNAICFFAFPFTNEEGQSLVVLLLFISIYSSILQRNASNTKLSEEVNMHTTSNM